MLDVRSRAGVVAVTTGVTVLFALPVVAFGQVPGVDEVVGGVQETVDKVAPAPVPALPTPPVRLPAPAPSPKPQSSPSAPSAPTAQAPSGSAPAQAPASSPAAPTQDGSGSAGASSSTSAKAAASAADGKKKGRVAAARAASDDKAANASQDDGAPTDVDIASQVADVTEEANPSTLPFTGFQLALMGVLGLTALAGGLALRRGARGTG